VLQITPDFCPFPALATLVEGIHFAFAPCNEMSVPSFCPWLHDCWVGASLEGTETVCDFASAVDEPEHGPDGPHAQG